MTHLHADHDQHKAHGKVISDDDTTTVHLCLGDNAEGTIILPNFTTGKDSLDELSKNQLLTELAWTIRRMSSVCESRGSQIAREELKAARHAPRPITAKNGKVLNFGHPENVYVLDCSGVLVDPAAVDQNALALALVSKMSPSEFANHVSQVFSWVLTDDRLYDRYFKLLE